MDGEGGNGLKLEKKISQIFQVLKLRKNNQQKMLWSAFPAKFHPKIVKKWLAFVAKFHLISSSYICTCNPAGEFCVEVKVLSNDFSTELT